LLCGVRGSTAAPGAAFAGVGGHTSCVAVPVDDDRWIVLDAGTGLRQLALQLDQRPLHGSILFSHLHWDHTQGLPFLANADRADAEVALWVPVDEAHDDPLAVLARGMSPPHFPITPDQLHGTWTFNAMTPGRRTIEGIEVVTSEIAHKGGRTFGHRLNGAGRTLAYLPDHCPSIAGPELLESARELIDGVDVLIHGGPYLDEERETAERFGHAVIADVLDLARTCSVRCLVLVHHAPGRTDAEIADIECRVAGAPVPVVIGREGLWVGDPSESGPGGR
jgi:phosphoribosyl 1,2-cyclic phosphodiesterase